jgi:hypothetical protein
MMLHTVPANAETVVFSLTSPQTGAVSPGQIVQWSIRAEITSGGSAGLALFAVNLVQDSANPESIDILPANEVPAGLEGFSRPNGISNPGEGGATTGFIGVQRGTPGAFDLHQIGGAQNSTGAPGAAIGMDVDLESGVGLGGPVVIAEGSFTAAETEGTYTYFLADALANTFDAINPPGMVSPVSGAETALAPASFQITVSTGADLGDLNCDGNVNTNDIQHFVQALIDPVGYVADHDGDPFAACTVSLADVNQDAFADGGDIVGFVGLLIGP